MDYLERNRVLLDEISSTKLTYCIEVGHSTAGGKPKTVFYSLGCYVSPSLRRKIYIGLKKPNTDSEGIRRRTTAELAVIKTIAKCFPHITGELPMFYGMLARETIPVGILMEDFSENNTHPVEEFTERFMISYPDHVPRELLQLAGPLTDDYDLAKM